MTLDHFGNFLTNLDGALLADIPDPVFRAGLSLEQGAPVVVQGRDRCSATRGG